MSAPWASDFSPSTKCWQALTLTTALWEPSVFQLSVRILLSVVALKYSKTLTYTPEQKVNLVLVNGSNIEIYTDKPNPIEAPVSEVRYGVLPSSNGLISHYLQVDGKKYVLPSTSTLNRVKIAELFNA